MKNKPTNYIKKKISRLGSKTDQLNWDVDIHRKTTTTINIGRSDLGIVNGS